MASSIRVDMRSLTRGLNDLARKQVPFAAAQMATSLARRVQAAETAALRQTFDKPTPFTERAFGVIPARKANPVAVVFAKDIQASYLQPFGDDGDHRQVLKNRRAILNPRAVQLNTYGNLPKGKVAALKGRPDVFVGVVKTASGEISGVWQRQTMAQRNRRRRAVGLPKQPQGGLKLLIRFTDPVEVPQRLHFRTRAEAEVRRWAETDWKAAFAKAMATAR